MILVVGGAHIPTDDLPFCFNPRRLFNTLVPLVCINFTVECFGFGAPLLDVSTNRFEEWEHFYVLPGQGKFVRKFFLISKLIMKLCLPKISEQKQQ